MAYTAQDSWSSEYGYLVDLSYQIQSKLRERERTPSAYLETELTELISRYEQSLETLRRTERGSRLLLSESERKKQRTQLDELTTKLHGYRRSLAVKSNNNPFDDDMGRYGHTGGLGAGPGLASRMNEDEIRTQQKQIIAEQDKGLDALSAALRRQRKIGLAIQDEVSEHNILIDDITHGTTHADSRIRRETRRIDETRRKDSNWCSCALWIVVLVLALAIIIVAVVPYGGRP